MASTISGRLAKSWAQRLRINGKPVNIGLGAYPVVTLAEARKAALENRRAVEDGVDPRVRDEDIVPLFEEAVEKVIAIHAEGWREVGRSAN